jgi:hypothetical protein
LTRTVRQDVRGGADAPAPYQHAQDPRCTPPEIRRGPEPAPGERLVGHPIHHRQRLCEAGRGGRSRLAPARGSRRRRPRGPLVPLGPSGAASASPARLAEDPPRTAPSSRHPHAFVARVQRDLPRRLRLQPVRSALPALEPAPRRRHAPGAQGGREAVRGLPGGGDPDLRRAQRRGDLYGRTVRGRPRGLELHLRRGHPFPRAPLLGQRPRQRLRVPGGRSRHRGVRQPARVGARG